MHRQLELSCCRGRSGLLWRTKSMRAGFQGRKMARGSILFPFFGGHTPRQWHTGTVARPQPRRGTGLFRRIPCITSHTRLFHFPRRAPHRRYHHRTGRPPGDAHRSAAHLPCGDVGNRRLPDRCTWAGWAVPPGVSHADVRQGRCAGRSPACLHEPALPGRPVFGRAVWCICHRWCRGGESVDDHNPLGS